MISWDIQSLELIQKKNCSAECVDRKTHLKSEVRGKMAGADRNPNFGYKTALQDGKRTGTYYIVPLYSG